MARPDDFVPLAIATRSGFDESVHHGVVVVLDESGTVSHAWGNPDAQIYGRSSNKPLQAAAMLDLGFRPTLPELAIACASHSGDAMHIDAVRALLDARGLDEHLLDNTATLPYDRALADQLVAAGGGPTPIHQNCSGKHAAMLATCAVNDWPLDTYLDPTHPLQQAITSGVAELAGGVLHVGIDGCGAPTHATSLVGLARAFGRLAREQGPVWQAMTTHPELVGGEGREVTDLMRTVPGLMAKDGADGVLAGGLPDGRSVAIKVGDGAKRAIGPIFARALQHAGELADVDISRFGEPLLGHGQPVGAVTPLF